MQRLLLCLLVCASIGRGQDFTRSNPRFLEPFKVTAAPISRSVVRIVCNGKDKALGVVVDADGLILTKASDLAGAVGVQRGDGITHDAEIVGVHQAHDLALLRIDVAGLTPIVFSSNKEAAAGAWVLSPGLRGEVVAVGIVSVPTRNITAKRPAAEPKKSPYLGVMLEPADDGDGAKITSIVNGTPAEKIGLKAGDVIISLSGHPIANPDAFMQTLAMYRPGDMVTITARRGDVVTEYSVFLERRPLGSFRGEMQNRMGSELSVRRTGYSTILQHDSIVKPTDCGGPLVDLDGQVLGLNISRAGRVESWALPSSVIVPLLPDLKSGKLAPKSAATLRRELEGRLAAAKSSLAKAEEAGDSKAIEGGKVRVEAARLELDEYRVPEAIGAAERLLNLMRNRLVMMNDVAAWKWSHRVEIHDASRERDLLDRLTPKTSDVDAAIVRRFFAAQFEAARRLQQDRVADWQKTHTQPATPAELGRDLRPRIDKLNEALLASLLQVAAYRKEADLKLEDHLRRRARQILVGPGITDSVRSDALAGLLAAKQ